MFPLCRCSVFDTCSNSSSSCLGNATLFPFGAAPGCGHPDFQIQCHSDHSPTINISRHQYRILKFRYADQSIQIVDEAAFSSYCYLPNATLNISGSPFQMLPHSTLYLFIHCLKQVRNFSRINCSTDSYLAFSDDDIKSNWSSYKNTSRCESVSEIPTRMLEAIDYSTRLIPQNYWTMAYGILAQGFGVKWETDQSYQNSCRSCNSSQGICGYNVSDPEHPFLCHCRKAPSQPLNCFDGISRSRSRRGEKVIIETGIVGCTLLVLALLLIMAYRKKISSFSRQVLRRKRAIRGSVSKVEMFLHKYVDEMPTRYSYSTLKKITDNFAHELGKGGFGVVYKGRIPNGNLVAVKMLDQSRESETQFMNEVATIGRIHHIHLIRLLGYCFEGPTSALVYEYMKNGSLEKFIFARREDQILNWDQLYSIALGAARGIAYLHGECHGRIVHFDIKPHNILLDEDFTAKVADFGLAKLCGKRDDHVSMTAARGTPGYVAPEVWSRSLGPVTDKSDVYSFGMLLLEMVGGRKNIDIEVSRSSQFYFPEWEFKLIENEELRTRLRERELSGADEAKSRSLAKVGLWCIQYNSRDRPSMMRVLQMLEGDADDIPNPPNAQPALLAASQESSSTEIETASAF